MIHNLIEKNRVRKIEATEEKPPIVFMFGYAFSKHKSFTINKKITEKCK